MYKRKTEEDIRCPLEYGMSIISGKWKSRIICLLGNASSAHYGELKADLINIADGVLGSTMNELISMEIVEKITFDKQGNSPWYRLTEKGTSLIPLLHGLCHWSATYYRKRDGFVMSHCTGCEYYKEWENA